MKTSTIKPEIFEKYNSFYALATGNYQNAFVFENLAPNTEIILTEDALNANSVVITNCPTLTNLDFLSSFENAQYILVKDLKLVTTAFDISNMPNLKGVAFIGCKRLTDFEKLASSNHLQNIVIESGVFNGTCVKTLAPLCKHSQLKTLDLAFNKLETTEKYAFNDIWKNLEALTISPNLRKYFVSQGDK